MHQIRRALPMTFAFLLASCAAGDGPDPAPARFDDPPPARGGDGIQWQLSVQPSSIRASERDRAVLRITATNRGGRVADTERDALALNVNGEDSEAFALALGNGARDARWSALPPGESVSEERVGLAIFDGPGDYELLLHRGERVFARASARVVE